MERLAAGFRILHAGLGTDWLLFEKYEQPVEKV
jgi:hypothetical protein